LQCWGSNPFVISYNRLHPHLRRII
jgi:hypothetical protein